MRIYRVADAVRELGLHPETIRKYEGMGPIEFHRDQAGWRVLFDDDLDQVRKIYAERMAALPPHHPARSMKAERMPVMAA